MFSISRVKLCKSCSKAWKKTYTFCFSTIVSKKEPISQGICGKESVVEPYGQPTTNTHPHLLHSREVGKFIFQKALGVKKTLVIPGLEINEFSQRREKLLNEILKTSPDNQHLVVIPSAKVTYMTEKIPYLFRQNTDFMYFTGCLEPDSTLVVTANKENIESTLFLRKRDKHAELWEGPRTGVERAPSLFGIDNALPISSLGQFISSFTEKYKSTTLWYDFITPVNSEVHSVIRNYMNSAVRKVWESPKPLIHKQRVFKSPAEQKLMQDSCNIASLAIASTMAATKPGITEHQLFAIVDYECRINGAEYLAYPPVVAAGNNANTIHYISNTQKTKPSDMVLMDAGCEYHGYASDITRTWPVSGKFTDPQRVLYEIVLSTQSELIKLCHGLPSLDYLFHCMCQTLGKKLIEAKVTSNPENKDLAKLAYELCPHHVSHYLGMDVHDTSQIPRSINLQPDMVITIEPGVYISQHNQSVQKEFRGQGLRIEDDILITNSGPVVLSARCPKEIDEIEKLVGSKTRT